MKYWFVFHYENSELRHLLNIRACPKGMTWSKRKTNDCGYRILRSAGFHTRPCTPKQVCMGEQERGRRWPYRRQDNREGVFLQKRKQ